MGNCAKLAETAFL